MSVNSTHRQMLLPVYLPAMLLGIPAQASFVLLPLYVLQLGGSASAAAAVIGFRGLGMVLMDIPAGLIAARWGDKFVMLSAIAAIGLSHLAFALSDKIYLLYLIAFLYGAGGSTFLLGRMSFITDAVDPLTRGRVIALIAGSMRASALIGPVLGTWIAVDAGYDVAFFCAVGCAALSWACVKFFTTEPTHHQQQVKLGEIGTIAITHRRVFYTAGIAAIVFMVLRSARTVLVPLIGAALNLDTKVIGMIVSISAAVDVLMFYPAGLMMDKYGRRATAVPSSILFTIALALLALANSSTSLLLVAIFLGFANGLSTGIVMTLGTDLAPLRQRAAFLGIWRVLTDVGTSAGPLIVGSVVAVAPIAIAALCIGALGAGGSFVIYRYVEETLNRAQ